MAKQKLPPEHDFSAYSSGDEWEDAVVRNAAGFTTYTVGRIPMRMEHPSFKLAVKALDGYERGLLYAITATGRSTLVPRDRWPAYLPAKHSVVKLPKAKHRCAVCSRSDGRLTPIGNAYYHGSCWRTQSLKGPKPMRG